MKYGEIIGELELYDLAQIEQLYLKIAEKQLQDLKQEAKQSSEIPEEECDEYGKTYREIFEEDLIEKSCRNDQLQQILFRSFLLTVSMFVESGFRELCNHLQKKSNKKISITARLIRFFLAEKDTFRKSGMTDCLRYIRKSISRSFLKNDPDLQALIELRNLIIHSNAYVSPERQKNLLKSFSKSSFKIDFKNNNLFIHESSLKFFIDLARRVYDAIDESW